MARQYDKTRSGVIEIQIALKYSKVIMRITVAYIAIIIEKSGLFDKCLLIGFIRHLWPAPARADNSNTPLFVLTLLLVAIYRYKQMKFE